MQTTQNAGQTKMANFIGKVKREDDKNLEFDLSMCEFDLSMCEFNENVKKALNIDESVIEYLAKEICLRLTKLDYCLIPSKQLNITWRTLFHITKKPVDIHNISSSDALDIHKSSGTRSYSFTSDKTLLSKIIKELEEGNFTMEKINY